MSQYSRGWSWPWTTTRVFVAGKDMAANTLVVVQGHGHPRLYRDTVDATALHWIAGAPPVADVLALLGAKTRYRMPDAPCALALDAEGGGRATFASPQWAPTPGQYLVLYDGDVCLGGGVIVEHAGAVHPAPEPSPA